MPKKHLEDDFSHIPNVAYVSPLELKPSRVLIGLGVAAIVIALGTLGYLLVDKLFLGESATAVPNIEITKKSPTTKVATPSAQKDETADWKIEVNEKLGYSVKYPNDWGTREECTSEGSTGFFPKEKQRTERVGCVDIYPQLYIYRRSSYKVESRALDGSSTLKNTIKESIKIGDYKGVKWTGILAIPPLGDIYWRYVINDKSDSPLIIDCKQLADGPDYSSIFEKMISTLKFLD